jgi:hypothetical protein
MTTLLRVLKTAKPPVKSKTPQFRGPKKGTTFLLSSLAPYERAAAKAELASNADRTVRSVVGHGHGGYAVAAEGYVTGPFFWYESASRVAATFTDAIVVRWVDFVIESTREEKFSRLIEKLTEPMTVKIKGYGRPVHFNT